MSEFDPSREPGEQPGQPEQPRETYGESYGQPSQQGQSGQAGQQPAQWPGYSGYAGGSGYSGQTGWERYGSPQSGSWQQQTPPGAPPRTQYLPPYSNQPYPPRRSGLRSTGLVIGAIGLAVLIGLGLGRYAWQPTGADQNTPNNSGGSVLPGQGSSGSSSPASNSLNVQAIAAKVDPGLVDITSVLSYQNEEAAGTGIVLTSNGDVLTNNHVVEGATSIQVNDIGNGRTYKATVVGFDRSQDIAVLHLTGASGLTTAAIGDSSKVSVGDSVIGIGNAGGTGGTPSAAPGSVTALNQSITASDESSGSSEQLTGLIQVAADIRSGDSGGSLVNSSGQVIGMDTAATVGYQFQGRSADSPNSSGEGFAIPINQAVSIAHQIETGSSTASVHTGETAFLGVSVISAGGQSGDSGSGAIVQKVVSGSPSDQAGIAAGDTIVSVDGHSVGTSDALTTLMDQHHPGDQLTVVWTDQSGQQHSASVIPATGPVG